MSWLTRTYQQRLQIHGNFNDDEVKNSLNKYFGYLIINSKNTDLTNLKKVTKLIKKNNPKYIFHCANKVFGTGGNQSNKFQMLNENLIINSNLLKAIINTTK